MGRSSAILLRRREWTVNKENWSKTVQHNATHRPRGRVPHKPTTQAPKQQETTLNNNLSRSRRSDIQTSATHTPVPRPRPCEADDLATHATKVDTNEAKKKVRSRCSDLHTGPRAAHTPSRRSRCRVTQAKTSRRNTGPPKATPPRGK
jgi:hypothetical protein